MCRLKGLCCFRSLNPENTAGKAVREGKSAYFFGRDREEIYEMVIREMTETAVRERNEQSPEEQELQGKVARLSKEMQEKIKDLPEDVKKAITDYVEATLLAADHDCLYLYVQGAKECVTLLKKLGVL